MPRPRRAASSTGDVPAELLDPDHAVWLRPKRAKDWLLDRGLSIAGAAYESLDDMHPLDRHKAAAERWTVAQGHFKTYGSSSVRSADLVWMREAGIRCTFHRRLRANLDAAGVRTEV